MDLEDRGVPIGTPRLSQRFEAQTPTHKRDIPSVLIHLAIILFFHYFYEITARFHVMSGFAGISKQGR
jgi:hypothetical protein